MPWASSAASSSRTGRLAASCLADRLGIGHDHLAERLRLAGWQCEPRHLFDGNPAVRLAVVLALVGEREGQHIRGLVEAAVLPVQLPHHVVAGEHYAYPATLRCIGGLERQDNDILDPVFRWQIVPIVDGLDGHVERLRGGGHAAIIAAARVD